MRPARHRTRKAEARRVHATRLDNRRPEGSERLSDIRRAERESRPRVKLITGGNGGLVSRTRRFIGRKAERASRAFHAPQREHAPKVQHPKPTRSA